MEEIPNKIKCWTKPTEKCSDVQDMFLKCAQPKIQEKKIHTFGMNFVSQFLSIRMSMMYMYFHRKDE